MASILKVDTIQDQDGNNIINESANTITIGASGDTITIPSGATLANSGIITGFESTGIDDNATSTAITIDSSENVGIGTTSPANLLHLTPSQNSTALQIANTNDTNGIRINSGVSGLSSNSLQFLNVSGDSLLIIDGTNKSTIVGNIGPSGYRASFGDFEVKNQDGANNSGGTLVLSNTDGSILGSQILGNLTFASYDQSGATTTGGVASIRAIASETYGSTSGASLLFYTHPSSANNGTVDGNMSERMRIDSSGNVGIGTSSPANELDVNGSIRISFDGGVIGNGDEKIKFDATGQTLQFQTADIERMRIDSSGNLNINTTTKLTDASISSGATGISLRGDADVALISRDGGYGLVINRKTSDGELVEFRKDGSAFGNIGTVGGSAFYISGNNNVGLQFNNVFDEIRPCNSDGSARDNAIDLGNITRRFDDIFATNGTIQTSDQNEKQSIQSLTTAEMNVAKRLSALIKTFKWNSAVEEKGDSARTHTGIIAQDVQQAFTDEGLDSSNYALFISGTWWEKEISVEATEEKEAHTYIDIKEEATEGYTERTRLGVRYPELLSFIQAYNDQRFTELEARITALEANNP